MTAAAAPTQTGAHRAGGRQTHSSTIRLLRRLGTITGVLLVWQAITSAFTIPVYILPQPSALAVGLIRDRETLLTHLQPLVIEATGGFILGNGAGVLLAVLSDRWATLKATVLPLALAVRSIPLVAITARGAAGHAHHESQ